MAATVMRPAFSSTAQTVAFALLLLLLSLSPLLLGGRFLPPRNQGYASAGWDWGAYPWILKQIFEETNDIDIAFVGSSHINWGIDTPYVQQQLDLQLGHESVVRSICWGGAGFDGLYFIAKDLLAHRHVKTLVFYDETIGPHLNPKAPKWFRYDADAADLDGLPLKDKGIFYFAAMTGMPDNLMELAFPNLPEDTNSQTGNYFEKHYRAANPETRLGSISGRVSFDSALGANTDFAPYIPNTGATPSDVCVYAPANASKFLFTDRPLPGWQVHFARQFGSLAKKYGCQLVLLHMPVRGDCLDPVIQEPRYWPDFLQTDVAMIGIPGRQLFAGLSDADMKHLYGDEYHLNQNGQRYFTTLITPALLQIHENRPVH